MNRTPCRPCQVLCLGSETEPWVGTRNEHSQFLHAFESIVTVEASSDPPEFIPVQRPPFGEDRKTSGEVREAREPSAPGIVHPNPRSSIETSAVEAGIQDDLPHSEITPRHLRGTVRKATSRSRTSRKRARHAQRGQQLAEHINEVIWLTRAAEDIFKTWDLSTNRAMTKPLDFDQGKRVVHCINHFWSSMVSLPEIPSTHERSDLR